MSAAAQGLQQSQRQTQKITITPQLRQSLRILQLHAAELRQEINNELSVNPLLEELPPTDSDVVPPSTAAADNATRAAAPDFADASGDSTDADADPVGIPLRPPKHDTPAPDDDQNEALQKARDDWGNGDEFHDTRDFAQTGTATGDGASNEDLEKYRQHLFDSAPQAAPSLEAHLLAQARENAPDKRTLAALETLIGELDERGFLAADIAELSLQTDSSRAELDAAWRLLRTFEPPGIGAADLRECLLLQLYKIQQRESPEFSDVLSTDLPVFSRKFSAEVSANTAVNPLRRVSKFRIRTPESKRTALPALSPLELAIAILETSYPLLLKRRIPELASTHRVTTDAVREAFGILAKLETSPARFFERDENRVLIPDITIRRGADGAWEVFAGQDVLPRLRLNPEYKSCLGDKNMPAADRDYISSKIREGRYFINAIEQRQQTLCKIAQLLLKYQSDYFEVGPHKLRPLMMAQIASELGVHETTVGRALANKSVATPYGVRELRSFFSAGVVTADGESLASSSVRDILQQIIASAPADAPYSDERLVKELKNRGITLARRTVAKYRAAMNILPAHLRRSA